MRAILLAVIIGTNVHAAVAGQMYKCTDGATVVFQDRPCGGSATGGTVTVKPANEQTSTEASPGAPQGDAATAKLRQNVHSMEVERKQRDIDYSIRGLERQIEDYQSQMDREINALQYKKRLAKNNLAGATWEQSISQEMQAVSEKYRTKIQITQDRIAFLRRDYAELGKARQP